MRTRLRSRGLVVVVLATITMAMVMLTVAPGSAHPGVPGPLAAVDFVDTWTNDDGVGGDGDDGGPAVGYNAWLGASSADPDGPGPGASRVPEDVGICTSVVNAADPNLVDVTILTGYPGYVCTFSVVVFNGSTLPATVEPVVLTADTGLLATAETPQLPAVLGPGEEAEAAFAVEVLQIAPPGTTLHATYSIAVSADWGHIIVDKVTDPVASPIAFEFDPNWGDNFFLADEDAVYDSGLLEPGTYSLQEVNLPEHWILASAACIVDGVVGGDPMDPGEITLNPGETVVCTFTNFETGELGPTAVLNIVKEARPADGTVFWFDGGSLPDFSLSDPSASFKQFTELEPGEYTITELSRGLDDTWQFEKVVCDALDWSASGQAVTVNLAEGEIAVCTFTNAEELPFTGMGPWLIPTGLAGLAIMLAGLLLARRSRRHRTA